MASAGFQRDAFQVDAFDAGGPAQISSAGGGGRHRRLPVIDMVWPDDPRHPNYIGLERTDSEPRPVRQPKRALQAPSAKTPPLAIVFRDSSSDDALSFLLLAL